MRLRARLFLLVFVSSVLPASLVLLAGWLQLRQQVRLWTIPTVEAALDASLQTNRRAFDRLQRHLEAEGRVLAESRLFPPTERDTLGLSELLDAGCRQFGIDLAQYYDWSQEGFALRVSRTVAGPEIAAGADASSVLQVPASSPAGPQRPAALRLPREEDDILAVPTFLWRSAPADSAPQLRGALLLGISLGPQYYARLGEVTSGLSFYRRLEEVGRVLRTGYGILAVLILLLSLAVSLWIAGRVARSVSRPVERLIREMEEVGRGQEGESPSTAEPSGAAGDSTPATANVARSDHDGAQPKHDGARTKHDAAQPNHDGARTKRGSARSGRDTARPSRIPEMAQLAGAFHSMRATLRSYEERLRETERVRGAQETARFVAHEIRNTLTPVRAALSVLARQVDSLEGEGRRKGERALELIRNEADRMASLAGAFSEYAQFPERQPVRIRLADLVEELARQEVPDRIALNVEREPGLPDVEADRDEAERVFRNLIKNAVEAIPEKGEICLRLTSDSERRFLRITVQDSGCGMNEESLRKAFQPGYTTKEAGSGLGLALVRRSLSHYGGTVRLESEPGRGTRCVVELPSAGGGTGGGAAGGTGSSADRAGH